MAFFLKVGVLSKAELTHHSRLYTVYSVDSTAKQIKEWRHINGHNLQLIVFQNTVLCDVP